jgi:hypothetical protein
MRATVLKLALLALLVVGSFLVMVLKLVPLVQRMAIAEQSKEENKEENKEQDTEQDKEQSKEEDKEEYRGHHREQGLSPLR